MNLLMQHPAPQDLIDSFGHGSHVAGTILGSPYGTTPGSTPNAATGMAPGAKLAFMDLSSGNSDVVWTPGDLGNSYFQRTFSMGARVHSDSWGSDLTVYDSMAASADRFMWLHQDFVSVFAGESEGLHGSC